MHRVFLTAAAAFFLAALLHAPRTRAPLPPRAIPELRWRAPTPLRDAPPPRAPPATSARESADMYGAPPPPTKR